MKLLAIDSSGLVASVALQVDDILVGEYTIHNKKTHSQTLLPMIADMLAMADVDKHELDAIAVAAGPGSFTGLRIGASTAKGLAQVLDIPIVPVSTLMGLAYNLQGSGLVCPLMDARRSQAYYCIYKCEGPVPTELCEEGAEPIETILDRLSEHAGEVAFVGDGVPVFADAIREGLGERARFAADPVRYQRASSIAALGHIFLKKGSSHLVSAQDFAPVYLRKSQAEREREEAEKES